MRLFCLFEGLEQKGWRVRTEEQSDELVMEANNPLMISSCWNLIGELINNQSSKMGETFETYDIM